MGHPRGWVAGALALTVLAGLPRGSASAALLMDLQTGRVLYAKNAHAARPPASLTKVLTAILVLEHGRLAEPVTVSARVARTPGASLYLRAGDRVTLEELLQGILLPSANDAAVAAAEHLAGSVEEFARLMNRRAVELGATASHFRNPHDLTQPGHYSTAHDLALLARHALADPHFARLVAAAQSEVGEFEGGWERDLRNTNRSLRQYPGADGVKTGTTTAAGPCLIASAARGDQRLLVVLLNAPDRFRAAGRLLDWGFDSFELVAVARRGDNVATLPVSGSGGDQIHLAVDRDLWAAAPRGSGLQTSPPPRPGPGPGARGRDPGQGAGLPGRRGAGRSPVNRVSERTLPFASPPGLGPPHADHQVPRLAGSGMSGCPCRGRDLLPGDEEGVVDTCPILPVQGSDRDGSRAAGTRVPLHRLVTGLAVDGPAAGMRAGGDARPRARQGGVDPAGPG